MKSSIINHGDGLGSGETIKSTFVEATGDMLVADHRRRRICSCPPKSLVGYNFRKLFLKDLVAGVTVGFMAVPQAMSYATVAGLPPIFGLYNAFIGLLPYFLFGSSSYLITGPTAVMSILVDGTIQNTPRIIYPSHGVHVICRTLLELSVHCKVRVSMALTLSLWLAFSKFY